MRFPYKSETSFATFASITSKGEKPVLFPCLASDFNPFHSIKPYQTENDGSEMKKDVLIKWLML